MSETTINRLQYVRAIPEDWEDLVEFTHASMQGNADTSTPQPHNAIAVMERLKLVEDEELEENRYYALGLAICGVARAFRQPDIRADAVEKAANNVHYNLVMNSKTEHFSLSNVTSFTMHYAFSGVAQNAVNELQPSQHLLADCLAATAGKRQVEIANEGRPSQASDEWRTKEILNGTRTAQDISINIAGGTLVTLRRIVKFVRETQEISDDITDLEIIGAQDYSSILAHSGTLRIDEFKDADKSGQDRFLGLNQDGEVIFKKDQKNVDLPPSAVPSPDGSTDRVVLHAQRLKCPALHVPGMFRLAQDVVQEILIRADDKRRERLEKQILQASY